MTSAVDTPVRVEEVTAKKAIQEVASPRSRRRRIRITAVRPGLAAASIVLAIVVLFALVPGLFTQYSPIEGVARPLLAPSWEHLFGTDAVGRDVFARVVYGTRQSLLGAVVAVGLGLIVGSAFGIIAGHFRGAVDAVIMRAVDVLLSIPALLLSLAVIVLLGYGTVHAAIAVGVTSIAVFARMARSQTISVSSSEFVEAAYGAGATTWQVLLRHVVPNSLSAVLALAAVQLGSAVLQLSTLGFLGYGAPPPTPEWGLIISESRNYIATSWWLTLLPGVVIALVVLSTNAISRALQAKN